MCYCLILARKKSTKQRTDKGHEIPVPAREDFYKDLERATKPDRKSGSSRRSKKEKAKERLRVVSMVVPPSRSFKNIILLN